MDSRQPAALLVASLLTLAAGGACAAAETDEAETAAEPAATAAQDDDDRTFYALGVALSQNVAPFALTEEELAQVTAGLRDGVQGSVGDFDLQAYGPKLQQLAQGRMQEAASAEKEAASEFLAAAAEETGAEVAESGLVFTSVAAGEGATPTATDRVRVHYTGTLRDGTVFDSSVERGQPAEFGLDQVIPCWTEGLQRMQVGGKAKLVCPSAIAYGDEGRPPTIPGGATLVFEVELLDILTEAQG
jgi:FKBP-type peptidyl-prolyl cis-trans isomerase